MASIPVFLVFSVLVPFLAGALGARLVARWSKSPSLAEMSGVDEKYRKFAEAQPIWKLFDPWELVVAGIVIVAILAGLFCIGLLVTRMAP